MTARLYQFVGNKEAAPENLGENFAAAQTLPELSLDLLEQFFERLSPEDKIQVLRHKIVPVASLPHVTLYAAAGEQRLQDARDAGKRIIGQINPQDLRFTIRRKLGAELLNKATHHLRIRQPASSAFRRITDLQRFWFALMVLVFVVAWATLDGFYFNAALSFLCGGFFLAVIGLRLLCLLTETLKKSTPPNQNDDELPIYTVLVPLFREIRVLDQLVQSMTKLNYPEAKLDIKLILEETDTPMQRAVAALVLPECFDVIVVPAGKPQTKPRALNYALQFARGQLLTIYDAEDIPEPLQLRKAAAEFASAPAELACLQAELAFYNANENWLTRGIRAQMPQTQ